MTQRLKFTLLTLVVAGATWFAPAARADEWDKKTVMTFNEPVEIPGKVLPAGTYVFKLLDSQSDRTVVQVFTEDEKQLVTTIMAIPNYRLEPADKTIITFEERPSGSPEALHSWFYPGDNYGIEFVYPKSERTFEARSEQPATPAEAPALPVAPAEVKPAEADRAILLPEGELDMVIAQAAPSEPASDVTADLLPDTLPTTAGNFAIIPLFGILLLAGGFFTIRSAARQN